MAGKNRATAGTLIQFSPNPSSVFTVAMPLLRIWLSCSSMVRIVSSVFLAVRVADRGYWGEPETDARL